MSELAVNPEVTKLREQLMAAEPPQRVAGLHALECACGHATGSNNARLVQVVSEFVARGMPFYSNADPHYLAWVERAIDYWERLQRRRDGAEARSGQRERRTFARSALVQP